MSSPTFEIKKTPASQELRPAATTIAGLRLLQRHKTICVCSASSSSYHRSSHGVLPHDGLVDHTGLSHTLIKGDVESYISIMPDFAVSEIRAAEATKPTVRPACGNHGCRPMPIFAAGVGQCSKPVTSKIEFRVSRMDESWRDLERKSIWLKDPVKYRFFGDVEADPGITVAIPNQVRHSSADFMTVTSRRGTNNLIRHSVKLEAIRQYLILHLRMPNPYPPGLDSVPIGFFRAIAILIHARDRVQKGISAADAAAETRSMFIDNAGGFGMSDHDAVDDTGSETDDMTVNQRDCMKQAKRRRIENGRSTWSGVKAETRMKVVADITALLELFVAVVEIWTQEKLTEVPNVCALETDVDAPAMVPVRSEQ